MDRHMVMRRRLLITSLSLAFAWGAVALLGMMFQEGRIAALRVPYDATGNLLAGALLVTTWKWFRSKPKDRVLITVKDLRER